MRYKHKRPSLLGFVTLIRLGDRYDTTELHASVVYFDSLTLERIVLCALGVTRANRI